MSIATQEQQQKLAPTSVKQMSIFEEKTLKEIYEEICGVYLSDARPWVLGYSGGKDSTTALQLVWYALKELPAEKRQKPVFVISADTLVETPVLVDYIDTTLARIKETAKREGMPFFTEKLEPQISETFWVNLIGRGYPAPYSKFRWCTDRLKVRPANRFILERVTEHGEVILVLGVRKSESSTRAQAMSLRSINGSLLSRHSSLPNAFVYTPIADFSLDDVWGYLLQVPSPWGNNNRDLAAIYRNASAGECPLVIDDTTPSCGNSRFGCWVCTVVEKDRSMQAMIDHGEEWMEPLLEFRDFLASTQAPEFKRRHREYKRRGGFITITGDGRLTRGPYKLEFCKELLRKLLQIQQKVRANGPEPNILLISEEELYEIRRIWRMERQDWEDSVPNIYREVTGAELNWVQDDVGTFTTEDRAILAELCEKEDVPAELVAKLLDMERLFHGMSRRSGIYSRIDEVFREDWRTEEEVLEYIKERREEYDIS